MNMSMEASEITRRNEAIANFWGWEMIRRNDDGHCDWWTTEAERGKYPDMSGVYHGELCFNTDWNALMPVIEKIMAETKDGFHLLPSSTTGFISRFGLRANSRGNTPIEAAWMAVSDYILEKK